jgi:hypothetical protein
MIDWTSPKTIRVEVFVENNIFYGQNLTVTEDQYQNIIEMSKDFYKTGFEMTTEDGGFIIIPPELTKKTILKISILDYV